jgi:hypothetical protein
MFCHSKNEGESLLKLRESVRDLFSDVCWALAGEKANPNANRNKDKLRRFRDFPQQKVNNS